MKKFIFIFCLFSIYNLSYSQTYDFGAMTSSTLTVKTEGKILITEKSVVIESEGKTYTYELVKNVNGIIYFTDGVMTHFFSIVEQNGKKKGFEYDNMINFQMDKNIGGTSVIYWSKKLKE